MSLAGIIDSFPQTVLGRIDLPQRAQKLAPVPKCLLQGTAGPLIYVHARNGRLWQHQSLALQNLVNGHHTVVATGTASGKSLVFQAYAYDRLGQNPDATAIVFDPLRALAEDQLASWREAAKTCGLPPESIVKIDGSIPISERAGRLEKASVAIMTPDVCHAWLMRNTASDTVRRFVARLGTVVLDEAHVYDSVFGSNAGYLFRRLLTYRTNVAAADAQPCRVIAATATISNAAHHLTNLTGLPFQEITDDLNGARIYPRTIAHLSGETEDDFTDVVKQILKLSATPKFIAFMDNRQGVERIARQLGTGRVLAYRNGYEAGDRREIELALRSGQLAGVVSTSALELGINIPGLSLGMNLRLPSSRKSFRQRLGRIGRDGPGLFIIVGPPNLFAQYGQTMDEYYQASAEPSILYLSNRYIQFANAQCLARETSGIPADGAVSWPAGFDTILEYARRRRYPDEYRVVAQVGSRNPHVGHALRTVSEGSVSLINQGNGRRIGSSSLDKAIRENYPGAQYIHAGRSYQAGEWDYNGRYGDIIIPLQEMPYPVHTDPVTEMDINVRGIVEGNLALHQDGSSYIAEVNASVTETVTGCIQNHQLSQYPPEQRPQRRFETTGVLLRIQQDWMDDPFSRDQVARMLATITRYDCSIAIYDIRAATDPMLIWSRQHPKGQINTRCVLVYDNAHGSLRLTEALYRNLPRYLRQLRRSVEIYGEMVSPEHIRNLEAWAEGLRWPQRQTEHSDQGQDADR